MTLVPNRLWAPYDDVDDIGKEISFGHECSDTHQLLKFTDNLGRTFGGFGFGIFLTANGLLVKGHIIG